MPLNYDSRYQEWCKVCVGGGKRGQVILLVVSRGGGSRVFTFSLEGGSGKIWVMNQDLSRPPPLTLK